MFLDEALTRLGLNALERCDMITYWLLQLEASPFNVIYFVGVQRYAKAAKLDIVPSPNVVIRVFMAFRCLLHIVQQSAYLRVLALHAALYRLRRPCRTCNSVYIFMARLFRFGRGMKTYDAQLGTAEMNDLHAPAREGFVAVDWGGMNLKGHE